MVEWNVVPINFGQGVDTKTDPKLVVAGKLLRMENGVCTAPGQWAKRHGYAQLTSAIAGGGNLVSPTLLHAYNKELVCADSGYLYSYSPTAAAWINRGPYTSVEHSRLVVDQKYAAMGYADCAVSGNYVLYVWTATATTGGATGTNYVLASVLDTSTNTWLAQAQVLFSNSPGFTANVGAVKACLLGGSTLAVFYWKGTTANVVCQTVSISSGVATFNAAVSVTTNLTSAGTYGISSFDVMPTATGGVIIYQYASAGVNAGVAVSTISTAPAVVTTAQIADASYISPVHVNVDAANGNIWCYFCSSTGGFGALATSLIKYAVFDSSLNSVLAVTTAATFGGTLFVPSNLSAVKNSTTQQTLYFGYYTVTYSTTEYTDVLKSVTLTSAGVAGSVNTVANGATPVSRIITNGSNQYLMCMYRGGAINTGAISQPTFFLLWLNSTASYPPVVARLEYGNVTNQAYGATFFLGQRISILPNLALLSGQKFLYSYAAAVQIVSTTSLQLSVCGAFCASLDFAGANTYQAANAGEIAVLNGAMMHQYDGQTCNEFHFNVVPELLGITQGVAGSMADGTYSYIVIFQWTDANGNVHQSAPSLAKSITIAAGGGTASAFVTFTAHFLSQKTGVTASVYRTAASGTVYHLTSSPTYPLLLDPSVASVVFQDTNSDATITGRSSPYTAPGSAVLENGTPPPAMQLLSHNNRLWFLDSESKDVWYTKSFSAGNGLSPSPFLIEQIDKKKGDITALAEMDDKIVYFKQQGIVLQSGDGADNTGANSTLSSPQFVPSDVGCDQAKSVISYPDGVMFHSPNGIYALSRATQVAYIGMDVEAYNSQTFTGATLVPGKSQIRFLTSSGKTLVYDYIYKQWSTFTNHTGVSAANFQSLYCYATTGGKVFQESATSYLDGSTAYALLIQTGWLALSSVQNYQRVRRLIMLGDFANGNSASHNLSVAAAYDFSTTFQTAVTFAFGNAAANGVFQYRERLPIQKCDVISLLIQETTTGDSAETADLTNISFEAGLKRGVNKLQAGSSVG